ncbi:MAG: hypothetical protein JO189_02000 [Deltaproteobacteria bacterium]|nr:hypothetical protein [Deltaproteobacteria bacterium]
MTDSKSQKTSLTVSATSIEPFAKQVPLSVELIGLKQQGYARALLGDEIRVAPGKYFVQLTLPNGRRVTADEPISVIEGQTHYFDFPLSLTTERGAETTEPQADQSVTLEAAPGQDQEKAARRFAAGLPTNEYAVDVQGTKLLWRGDWAQMWFDASQSGTESQSWISELTERLVREAEVWSNDGTVVIQREPARTTALLLLKENELSAFIIPFDERFGVQLTTSVSWRRVPQGETDSRPSLDYDLGSAKTNAFLGFIRRGERAMAEQLSLQSLSEQAHELAFGKSESPIGATLGLYVLLRINEVDRVEPWTQNLYNRFSWLPDALAIRVEYLARSGDHKSAVDLLRIANLCGGPWFRSGMNYLLDRLALYVDLEEDERADIGITPEVIDTLSRQRRNLRLICRYLDPAETVCTFRNLPFRGVAPTTISKH